MSNISNVETMILVTYQIAPIPAAFENSLYQHLFDAVWSDRSMADEDIRVIVAADRKLTHLRGMC